MSTGILKFQFINQVYILFVQIPGINLSIYINNIINIINQSPTVLPPNRNISSLFILSLSLPSLFVFSFKILNHRGRQRCASSDCYVTPQICLWWFSCCHRIVMMWCSGEMLAVVVNLIGVWWWC